MRCTLCIWISLGAVAASAQTPAPLHFDAASVKVVDRNSLGRGGGRIMGGPGTSDPGRLTAPTATMLGLLFKAYGVGQGQVLGDAVQPRAGANIYSVTATMPPDTTKEQFETMLQNLLIDRFRLKAHLETRTFPAFELVVDKGGSKLKDATVQPDDGSPPAGRLMNFQSATSGSVTLREQPIGDLAKWLGQAYGTVEGIRTQNVNLPLPRVLDKTGLTGKYSFSLDYAPPGAITGPDDAPSDLPDLVVALRKQLGLDLNKIAGIPVDVIVVDSVDNVPTEN